MNTSSPRTFSSISTKISISEKRRTLALVSGRLRNAEIASAKGRLLLPVRIFMPSSLGLRRRDRGSVGPPDPSPPGARGTYQRSGPL